MSFKCEWALLLMFGVSGCAIGYPDLYTPASPTLTEPATSLERILQDAYEAQLDYAMAYETAARLYDLSNLPLIGAAAGAAGALYYGAHPDVLAAIGIGAGTYVATRSVLFSGALPDLYIEGHAAISCIRAEGPIFAGANALDARTKFQNLANELAAEITRAEFLYRSSRLADAASTEVRDLYRSAMASLLQSITSASEGLAAARKDLGAFNAAEGVFGSALAAVHTRVASRGREGRTVDFAQLQAGITGGIQGLVDQKPDAAELPSEEAPGERPLSDQQVIGLLLQASVQLNRSAQLVTQTSPQYAAALGRLAECPEEVD